MNRITAIFLSILMLISLLPPMAVRASENVSEVFSQEQITDPSGENLITEAENISTNEELNSSGSSYTMLESETIDITENLTLTNNTMVAYGANVFIHEGVTVTVPAGVELNIQGYVQVYGSLIVQPGGILTTTDAFLNCLNIWTGMLDVTGADISGVSHGAVGIQRNASARIVGIPNEMLYAITYVFSTEDIDEALLHASEYYRFTLYSASSFTVTNNVILPENTEWIIWKYQDADAPDNIITVSRGFIVSNNGRITVQSGAGLVFEKGTSFTNNGSIWVSEDAVFTIKGTFFQYGEYTGPEWRTEVTMTQSELEAKLADAYNKYNYTLTSEVVLTSDMTIDTGIRSMGISQYGSIVVPSGVTLTINGAVETASIFDGQKHGKIIVRDGGRLILNGYLNLYYTANEELVLEPGAYFYVNGQVKTWSSIEIGPNVVVETGVNGKWLGISPVNKGGTILPAVTDISIRPGKNVINREEDPGVRLWIFITPGSIRGATWTSSDSDIIDASNIKDTGNGVYDAMLGEKNGIVTLTATSIDGSGKTATVQLTITGGEEFYSVPMHRMYDPNSGEHFYTGAETERDFLVSNGWQYEGVGFNFPVEGAPVHRLYDPVYGEHLYTMDEEEMNRLLNTGWNYEGVAFNSAGEEEVPQYRLHNPNANRGGYHFTGSVEERDFLISQGWIPQGIGWYSCRE